MKLREKEYHFRKKLNRRVSAILREAVAKEINNETIKVLKGEISLEDFQKEITPFNKK